MRVDVMKCQLVRDKALSYGKIECAADVADLFRALGLGVSADEVFAIVCVATDGSVVGIHEVAHGDIASCPVHPRELFKRAILNNAAGIICGHCHPSGSVSPSDADVLTTARLVAAGELLGIQIVDHLIVTSDDYTSLSEQGLM